MVKLFFDTDGDVTPEVAKKYNAGLISMPYSINLETVYPYKADNYVFDPVDFYEKLKTGPIPSTSAINKDEYIEYFEPYFAKGDDILYIHFSRSMSATFDNMDKAVRELKEKYPERKFYEIDTKAITALSLALSMEMGDLYLAGKTPEEIIEWSKTEIFHYAIYFFADDLKFFQKSGRVGGLTATMGTLLGIRPIISIGENGKMESIGKEKGRKSAINRLLTYMDELGDDIEGHRVFIANTYVPDLVAEVKERIKEKYPRAEIIIVDVNPTAGSHCGPGALGISFHSKQR